MLETGIISGVIAIALFIVEIVVYALIVENSPPGPFAPTFGIDVMVIFLAVDLIVAFIGVFLINFLIQTCFTTSDFVFFNV